MRDSLAVRLHGMYVGEIFRLDNGRIGFKFDDAYSDDPNRPTLSQSFTGEKGSVRNPERLTSSGQVPRFFSNLLPEGHLRTYLANKAGVSESREFEMLESLGSDLPGAVEVTSQEKDVDLTIPESSSREHRETPLRFSLAGVQLKFSAVEKHRGGLTIPAYGIGGDWIVKLPSTSFERVPENEYSVMSLARQVGIAIPEVNLVPMDDIEGLPPEVANLDESNALAIRRFDRQSGRRIHMEDFAQVLAQRPAEKYNPQLNYTDLIKLVAAVSREEDVIDFSRRLMFNAIVGNGDMHLKNWTLLYPDGRTPELSPAYDFLCTTVYLRNDDMALKLGSTKKWGHLTLDDFAKVAEGAGISREKFVGVAVDTAVQFQDCWEDWVKSLPVNDVLKRSIERQIRTCPAIVSALRTTVVDDKRKGLTRD